MKNALKKKVAREESLKETHECIQYIHGKKISNHEDRLLKLPELKSKRGNKRRN
jgi:hypothetical protein